LPGPGIQSCFATFFTVSQPEMLIFLAGRKTENRIYYVKKGGKGRIFMREYYIDNIRWITVILVVIYHVVYMFNGVADAGVAGPFSAVQYQDAIQYLLYPWFMALLFILSGMCARYALDTCSPEEFACARTRKLLVPSTIGLLAFHWIQGYVSIRLSRAEDMIKGAPGAARYLILAVSGTGVLWYIQMLWVFSMVLLLLRKLEKGRLTALCEK
ncbi:MAG TPA: hypothetical protein DF613_15415, partial [Lachnospiraceae bacterium]|nr:hypothetical protein [Lachnospiraceae bacterium]